MIGLSKESPYKRAYGYARLLDSEPIPKVYSNSLFPLWKRITPRLLPPLDYF